MKKIYFLLTICAVLVLLPDNLYSQNQNSISLPSILMSMGMMMLPPTLISMPFKILLFILVNGWDLIISSLVRSFK